MSTDRWTVAGADTTPDGYRDHLLYEGDSNWEAFKAIRAARRNDMAVTVAYTSGSIGLLLAWAKR